MFRSPPSRGRTHWPGEPRPRVLLTRPAPRPLGRLNHLFDSQASGAVALSSGLRQRAAMADWSSSPLSLCREAQGLGWAGAAQHAPAVCSDCCGCLSGALKAQSEFRSPAPGPSIAGCPRAQRRGHGVWGRLSFAYFSLARQRKVGAPPGAHPGLQRFQSNCIFNSCLRPPSLEKPRFHSKIRVPSTSASARTLSPAQPPRETAARTPKDCCAELRRACLEPAEGLSRDSGHPHAGPGRFE